jgi:hypothetical protein
MLSMWLTRAVTFARVGPRGAVALLPPYNPLPGATEIETSEAIHGNSLPWLRRRARQTSMLLYEISSQYLVQIHHTSGIRRDSGKLGLVQGMHIQLQHPSCYRM